ncbi:MAG: helix-turn-helix domain-containing protein [Kiloniellales bacterium]
MARRPLMGSKIRRLRRERAISQVEMARQLGISASYLNLIEHNQRPLTLPLLLKLADRFQVDLQNFSQDSDARLLAELSEMSGDSLFRDIDIASDELREIVDTAPAVCRAVLAVYRAHRRAQEDLQALAARLSDGAFLSTSAHELRTLLTNIRSFSEILRDHEELDFDQRRRFTGILATESRRLGDVVTQMLAYAQEEGAERRPPAVPAAEIVADYLQRHDNHFPELEVAAETLRRETGLAEACDAEALARLLGERYGQAIKRCAGLPPLALTAAREQAAPLLIGELEPATRRRFRLARRLAEVTCAAAFDRLLEDDTLVGESATSLCRRALANYVAGALLMPYDAFLAAARDARHDIAVLQGRFGASFEQVCHRLSTLQRVGARGLPIHFLRVDIAGNLSKRFSASGLSIPRFGGLCPRWNVHAAFLAPGRFRTQVSQLPDGSRFFDLACTVEKPHGGHGTPPVLLAVNIGCDIAYADQLVYSDGIDLTNEAATMPIGATCRLCERLDCRQRAQEPILPSLHAG